MDIINYRFPMCKSIKKIVFISYLDRSGSTFFTSRLGALPNVFAFPECEWLIDNVLIGKYVNIDVLKQKILVATKEDEKLKNWGFTRNEIEKAFKDTKTQGEIFLNLLNIYKNRYDSGAFVGVFKRQDILFYKYIIVDQLSKFIQLYWFAIIRNPVRIFSSMKNTIDPYLNKQFEKNIVSFFRRWLFSMFLIKDRGEYIWYYEYFMTNLYSDLLNIASILKIDFFYDKNKVIEFYNRLTNNDKLLHKSILLEDVETYNAKRIEKRISILEIFVIKILTNKFFFNLYYKFRQICLPLHSIR